MADPQPSHLRLHVEEHPDEARPRLADFPGLSELCEAFAAATGWRLSHVPPTDETRLHLAAEGDMVADVAAAGGASIGRLMVAPSADVPDDAHRAPREAAFALARALGDVLTQWSDTRRALWEREAELAAGVPVARRRDEGEHLAERLQSVLEGGAAAVGAQAAALYLLDDATSCLKLRSSWGLPDDRLLAPPRALRGALADLEALLGHAVVLEDAALLPHWRMPEPSFPAAACVPVASPTSPLGTLWVFSDTPRDFTSQQTNLLEIVAGRVAADLEREMLLAQQMPACDAQRLLSEAARWRCLHAPNVRPLLDGWDVAGWTTSIDTGGGELFDWFMPPDGRLAAMVASVADTPIQSALTAALVQGAVKSHARQNFEPAATLDNLHETLCSTSAGGPGASALVALVDPLDGQVDWSAAGRVRGLVLGGRQRTVLRGSPGLMGLAPEANFAHGRLTLRPGQTLLIVSRGVYRARAADGRMITGDDLSAAVRRVRRTSAGDCVDAVRRLLADQYAHGERSEQTVLAIRRLPRPGARSPR